MDSYPDLGDDLESSVSVHPVGGKSAPVQCKYPVGFKLLGQDSQSGVRKIHRNVAYFSIRTATCRRLLVEEGIN
jgi:hypothetical protein